MTLTRFLRTAGYLLNLSKCFNKTQPGIEELSPHVGLWSALSSEVEVVVTAAETELWPSTDTFSPCSGTNVLDVQMNPEGVKGPWL